MNKSLDLKLDKIRNGNYQNIDFIIADAKDGDMGGRVFAPGPMLDNPEKPKPYKAYLQAMREMTDSGLIDIMLMSSSSAEILTDEKIFQNSAVTPAVRSTIPPMFGDNDTPTTRNFPPETLEPLTWAVSQNLSISDCIRSPFPTIWKQT